MRLASEVGHYGGITGGPAFMSSHSLTSRSEVGSALIVLFEIWLLT